MTYLEETVLKKYEQGIPLKHIAKYVTESENIGKRKAKAITEEIIYQELVNLRKRETKL